MELEETQGTFQSPVHGNSSISAHFDVSAAAQNDGSCLVSACFRVPGGRKAWMNGQAAVPSSCCWAEGAELKMHFKLRRAVTFRRLLHSCTAPMLAHALESAPILISALLLLFLFFSHLFPKLLGGSTCLYNCAFTKNKTKNKKHTSVFSLSEAAVVKHRSN